MLKLIVAKTIFPLEPSRLKPFKDAVLALPCPESSDSRLSFVIPRLWCSSLRSVIEKCQPSFPCSKKLNGSEWKCLIDTDCQIFLQERWIYSGSATMVSLIVDPKWQGKKNSYREEKGSCEGHSKTKSTWFFIGWVLARKEEQYIFSLLLSDMVAGCESFPFWSPKSIQAFCLLIFTRLRDMTSSFSVMRCYNTVFLHILLTTVSLKKKKKDGGKCVCEHKNWLGFPGGSVVKNLLADAGLILGPGRSPGEGNGNPF